MGDRANIVIRDPDAKGVDLYLYGHWSGGTYEQAARAALSRGRGRWDDGSYLARIVFQDLVGDDRGTTGFGIAAGYAPDNEHDFLVLDVGAQRVRWERPIWNELRSTTFADFVKGSSDA